MMICVPRPAGLGGLGLWLWRRTHHSLDSRSILLSHRLVLFSVGELYERAVGGCHSQSRCMSMTTSAVVCGLSDAS